MAEAMPSFVARRKPDWSRLEAALAALKASTISMAEVEQLDRLYRVTSGDLAYAQTHFPNTDVHRYLNQLSAAAYGAIYRPRADRVGAIKRFFARDFPETVRANMVFIQAAAALLIFGTVVGAISVALNPDAAQILVPEGAKDFIFKRKELWTDLALSQHAPSEMATQIFTNNLRVTFAAFALGITGGIGTIAVLVFNGLNVGALVTACAQGGLLEGILTFMAAHGPVELSIIAISGGAGLVLGHALIVASDRPRGEVLRTRALDAVKLVIGCAPFLTGIGVIEGFVSPGPLFPWWFKVPLGAALGTAFWLYLLRAGRPQKSP